jgi:hypothetical protein
VVPRFSFLTHASLVFVPFFLLDSIIGEACPSSWRSFSLEVSSITLIATSISNCDYYKYSQLSLEFFVNMKTICITGLAWQYTAETISIVLVELIIAWIVRTSVMTAGTALFVLSIFPLSLVFVATLEFFGFD